MRSSHHCSRSLFHACFRSNAALRARVSDRLDPTHEIRARVRPPTLR